MCRECNNRQRATRDRVPENKEVVLQCALSMVLLPTKGGKYNIASFSNMASHFRFASLLKNHSPRLSTTRRRVTIAPQDFPQALRRSRKFYAASEVQCA